MNKNCKNEEVRRELSKRYKEKYRTKTGSGKYEGKKRWTHEENKLIVTSTLSDVELSKKMERSVTAIQVQRSKLRASGQDIEYKNLWQTTKNPLFNEETFDSSKYMLAGDASEFIGFKRRTLTSLCQRDLIRYERVTSMLGGELTNYIIPIDEVKYLKMLVDTFGVRNAMKHYVPAIHKETDDLTSRIQDLKNTVLELKLRLADLRESINALTQKED